MENLNLGQEPLEYNQYIALYSAQFSLKRLGQRIARRVYIRIFVFFFLQAMYFVGLKASLLMWGTPEKKIGTW